MPADIPPAEGIPPDAGTGTHDRLLSWREAERLTKLVEPPAYRRNDPAWGHGAETMRATILSYLRRELAACHRFEVQQALRQHIARIEHIEPEAPR